MSNLISAFVQRRRIGSATRKAVLLYMADKAADDGTGIWTSKANIARDLELGVRTVQYAIRELVGDGLLVEIGQRDCKHGYTVEYGIVPGAIEALASTRDSSPDQGVSGAELPVDNSGRPPAPRAPHAPRAGVTPATDAPLPLHHVHPNHPYNTTTPAAGTTPVDNSSAQSRCLAVAGPGLCATSCAAIIATSEVIDGWLSEGIDLEADILPVIAARTRSARSSPIRTWGYFADAVYAAHEARLKRESRAQTRSTTRQAEITPHLQFYADWVNSERLLPADTFSQATAVALLRAGLVSAERLARRGVRLPQAGGPR